MALIIKPDLIILDKFEVKKIYHFQRFKKRKIYLIAIKDKTEFL